MTGNTASNCLFVGNPEGLLEGGHLDCRICRHMVEALAFAQQNHFDHIFIAFSEIQEPKLQKLLAFDRLACAGEIVLLCSMHEEAEVIETLRAGGLKKVRYLICPLKANQLLAPSNAQLNLETAKDRKIRELQALALQDDLTGLKNRRYLRHFLPSILREAEQEGFQVTLLLFDIDDFKHYNDTFGHPIGDRVLRQTADLIRRCCRTQDVVARLGGDEFAVVFWDRTCPKSTASDAESERDRRSCRNHPREAVFMAERFRREISSASFDMLGLKGKGSLTISGGLATFPADAANAESLFERADQAMFEAKRSGKNRLHLVGRSALNNGPDNR
jgi:PleD family two-component response regulator